MFMALNADNDDSSSSSHLVIKLQKQGQKLPPK